MLGTGIGGMDTIGERLVPMTDAGKVRRLGTTIVEQVMASGISARVARPARARQPGHHQLERVQHRHRGDRRGRRAHPAAASPSACCAAAPRAHSHYIWAGFDAMRVLSRRFNDEPEKASRPMSASAGGFVPGAGAGVLLLESLESRASARRPHPRRAARAAPSTAAATAAAAA